MRVVSISLLGAVAFLALGLLPDPASAVVLTGGKRICPSGSASANPNKPEYPALDGSCLQVFANQSALAGLSDYEKIEAAVLSCGLPNGPYSYLGDPNKPFDYVLFSINNPQNGMDYDFPADLIDGQIPGLAPEIDDGTLGLGFHVEGTLNNNGAVLTLKQNGDDVESQMVDLPGAHFYIAEKSSGGGNVGTLICGIRAWFRTADGDFWGINQIAIPHGVNRIFAGFAGGPSGLLSQNIAGTKATAGTVCADVNPAVLEKPVVDVTGGYHVTPGDPVNPVNVTSCTSKAHYCDPKEAPPAPGGPRRRSACNPKGESGGNPFSFTGLVNGPDSFKTYGGTGGSISFCTDASGAPTAC